MLRSVKVTIAERSSSDEKERDELGGEKRSRRPKAESRNVLSFRSTSVAAMQITLVSL